MNKRIGLGVFEAGAPQLGGTVSWSHPLSNGTRFRDPGYWTAMARQLDQAGFDFLFFAGGSFGYPSVGGELSEPLVRAGFTFALDGAYLIPALAAATRNLGFVVTHTTGADHPMHAVRKFNTLDHVTGGRIGWNIVTGAAQDTMAQVLGHGSMVPHDERYRAADEYVDLALKYWEGSLEDDVLVMDRDSGVFADPARMHRVEHTGTYFRSSGYLTAPPSPQRTPLLFQAGTSPAGRAFAARNAECVFVQGTTPERTRADVADLRARAAAEGRDPEALKVFVGVTVIVAPTAAEAATLRREFEDLQEDEVAAHYYAGNTGVDLLALDPDKTLAEQDLGRSGGQMGQSNLNRFLAPASPEGGAVPTVRQILDELKPRGTRGFSITGDPEQVADRIEDLVDATGLDGIMIEPVFDLATLAAFTDLVVPILRARGRLDPGPEGTTLRHRKTLREQMTGSAGPHLPATHRGAAHRP